MVLYYNDTIKKQNIKNEHNIINFNELKQKINNTKWFCNDDNIYDDFKIILNDIYNNSFMFNGLQGLPINVIIDLIIILSKNGNDNDWNYIKNINSKKQFSKIYWSSDIDEINEIKKEHNLDKLFTDKITIEEVCNKCNKITNQLLKMIQTRSGDESTSVFLTCQTCKNTIKKN